MLHYLECELQSKSFFIVFWKVIITWLTVISSDWEGRDVDEIHGDKLFGNPGPHRQSLGPWDAHFLGSHADCASILKVNRRKGAFEQDCIICFKIFLKYLFILFYYFKYLYLFIKLYRFIPGIYKNRKYMYLLIVWADCA